ncbi:MAG: flagellin [Ignavibacteria bacterium]|jgi:flagellin|nr:flagellin [Ignavibacteria bacterium]
MPFAIASGARIRTNIPAENAYNAMDTANRDISLRQLRLSTGKRINSAADDVAGYITSKSLTARNGALAACKNTVGDASNVCNVVMDSLENINGLMLQIKDATAQAASGALGTDEKIALAKASYRLSQQIQTVADSTVFGGRQLLDTIFTANFIVGYDAQNTMLSVTINMMDNNGEFDVTSGLFNVNGVPSESVVMTGLGKGENNNFAGISGLNLEDLLLVSADDLGIFDITRISTTLTSMANAIQNINKTATYLGGISNRLTSQEELLKNQITNFDAAISRIEDSDVAKEQLSLIKSQFLQTTSITSLAQANQNPNSFMKLMQ